LEQQRLTRLLAQVRADFEKDPSPARPLVPDGSPQGADARQLAAWTAVARALLNLDEFITRE
jgi:hypothetical protein